MTEYDNTNRGSIWKNDKKETDRHPDFTGSLNVGGVEYWVSAWKRDPNGNPKAPALSFSVKAKDEAQQQGIAQAKDAATQPTNDSFDDSIPF